MYEYCPIRDPSRAVSSRYTISFSVAKADPALPSPALKRCSLTILASLSSTSWPHDAAIAQVNTTYDMTLYIISYGHSRILYIIDIVIQNQNIYGLTNLPIETC